ncbi:MAG: HDOD domain-containing protein [Planctomycetaceae bacterium]
MPPNVAPRTALIARQPIFNVRKQVVAYELLFRSSEKQPSAGMDGEQATGEVLTNAFICLGLDELVGRKPAFVNMTRDFLNSDTLIPNTPGKLVLEVLEDIVPDADLIARVIALSERGFTIALDDFVRHSNLTPLLNYADIVKVDLPGVAADELADHVADLRTFPVQLLAEKVETYEEFETCKQLGFDLFQGYFLARPEVLRGRRLTIGQLTALNLLAKLNAPDVELAELEAIIITDATMAYGFLRFINSAHVGLRRKVSSIRQALALLGIAGVRNVVALLTLGRMSHGKPPELLRMAFVRGQMAMQLAKAIGHSNPSAYFMAGMISLLDAIMDTPLEQILDHLPLAEWLTSGLRTHDGPVGSILKCVQAYERGDFDRAITPQFDAETVANAYWTAVKAAEALDDVAKGPAC